MKLAWLTLLARLAAFAVRRSVLLTLIASAGVFASCWALGSLIAFQIVVVGTFVFLALTERRVLASCGFWLFSGASVLMTMRRVTAALARHLELDRRILPGFITLLFVLGCGCLVANVLMRGHYGRRAKVGAR